MLKLFLTFLTLITSAQAVAEVDTFNDLVSNLTSCQNVTLTSDITLDWTITISRVCINSITLNGNGHTLTRNNWRHLVVEGGVTLHLHNVTFDGENTGGGVYFYSDITGNITHNTFSNCKASYKGGGVFAKSIMNHTTFSGNTFTNCHAIDGGGGIYVLGSITNHTTFSGNTFTNCTSPKGGGISVTESISSHTFSQNSFENCRALQNNRHLVADGGGIDVDGSITSPNFTQNTFKNCTAQNHGGGIHVKESITSQHFSQNTFENCEAGWGTRSMFTTGNGGGIEVRGSITSDQFSQNTFENCEAEKGSVMSFGSLDVHSVGNIITDCSRPYFLQEEIFIEGFGLTRAPTTGAPTTGAPTSAPTTGAPTSAPTTGAPTTGAPTTGAPTGAPTSASTALQQTMRFSGVVYNETIHQNSQFKMALSGVIKETIETKLNLRNLVTVVITSVSSGSVIVKYDVSLAESVNQTSVSTLLETTTFLSDVETAVEKTDDPALKGTLIKPPVESSDSDLTMIFLVGGSGGVLLLCVVIILVRRKALRSAQRGQKKNQDGREQPLSIPFDKMT